MRRWLRLAVEGRELILSNMWCGQCGVRGQVRDLRGELHPSGDILLEGACVACGGKVRRLIETGETRGPADECP